MSKTLSLAMIMKDEIEDLDRIVHDYGEYFDVLYVTVTDRPTYLKLQKKFSSKKTGSSSKVDLSYFKWCDHFGKARAYNLSQVKTDYWMWIDLDDEIEGGEGIKETVKQMAQRQLDVAWFRYETYKNEGAESGKPLLWRERIVRTASHLTWKNAVCDETIDVPPGTPWKLVSDVVIKHRKSAEEFHRSIARNERLLEQDWQQTHSPETALHQGISYALQQKYDEALAKFLHAADKTKDKLLKIQALLAAGDCYIHTGKFDLAYEAADQAISLDANHPGPYWCKFSIYMAIGQVQKAVEFAETAMQKQMEYIGTPEQDPTTYAYKGPFAAAQAYRTIGIVSRAFELYSQVKAIAPQFIEQQSAATDTDWAEVFEGAYKDQKAAEQAIELSRYLAAHGGDSQKLFESLPQKLFRYGQLRSERNATIPARVWPKKSIAYFTGANPETWGPENIQQGIGGSEEAVIYLTRELAKLGWDITVFCERETIYEDVVSGAKHPVRYAPWASVNSTADTFDVFVASRFAGNVRDIKARTRIVDLHDTMPEESLTAFLDETDKIMVKSRWHRSLYPTIPDDKFVVVGNGIVKQHFKGQIKRQPHSAGYFSSYDRGLGMLLDMWPRIRKQVPDATLDIYYGWDVFDKLHGKRPDMLAYKAELVRKINDLKAMGVQERGRVGHVDLAQAMKERTVWLYPTEWTEIHCITALKTAEAGMHQVCTSVAALTETAPNATFIHSKTIYSDPFAQRAFIDAAVEALKQPMPSAPPSGAYWSDVAAQWDATLNHSK